MVQAEKTNRFITFDGIEGCGKTTQLRLAEAWLRARGLPVLATAEPGGAALGLKIREILLNRNSFRIGPEAELLLFNAARAQHVAETILPALQSGSWVLCDRFTDATVAYQGFGRGIDLQIIQTINAFSSQGLKPALTVLFDLPVETGLARARKRASNGHPEKAEDRFEQEDIHFHNLVRNGYLRLAAESPKRFCIVDATGSPEAIEEEIRRILETFILRQGESP
jgi:dTMP kinase